MLQLISTASTLPIYLPNICFQAICILLYSNCLMLISACNPNILRFRRKNKKRVLYLQTKRNKLGISFNCEDRQMSLHRNLHMVSSVTFSVKHLDVSTILCIFAARISYILEMSKYEIPFLTACIQAFGKRFSMTRQAAFRYLHKHKGLEFLIEFYDVEHLQSIDETIDDLLIICQKNGGTLA